jgi:hypothetical protein
VLVPTREKDYFSPGIQSDIYSTQVVYNNYSKEWKNTFNSSKNSKETSENVNMSQCHMVQRVSRV